MAIRIAKRARVPAPLDEQPAPTGRWKYTLAPEVAEDVRRRFEETGEPVAAIARACDVSAGTLRRIAQDAGWVRYRVPPIGVVAARAVRAAAERVAARPLPSPETARPPREETPAATFTPNDAAEVPEFSLQGAASIVARWCAAIEMHGAPPAEIERFVRTVRMLEKSIADNDSRAGAPSKTAGKGNEDDIPSDIDARREALARRIQAFMESRTDEECGLGPDGQRIE